MLAVVELEEGARLLTNIVDVAPELSAVPPGLAVEVEFEPLGDDLALPVFRPAKLGEESPLRGENPPKNTEEAAG